MCVHVCVCMCARECVRVCLSVCEEAQCHPVLSTVRGRGRAGKPRYLELSRESETHTISIEWFLIMKISLSQ